MSFRVQFTVSDSEYKELSIQSAKEGFPNVAEMCKTRSLQGKNTYAEMYKKLVKVIEGKQSGEEFYLRDVIDTPPALLGRWLYDNVANGKIPNVEHLGNDGTNPERYRKK